MYDSGLLTLCQIVEKNQDGGMPTATRKDICTEWFEERTIGITRAYLARGADEQIDMLVRIQDEGVRPTIGMHAVLRSCSLPGEYRITLVQPVLDDFGLKAYDLTLARFEGNYDSETE